MKPFIAVLTFLIASTSFASIDNVVTASHSDALKQLEKTMSLYGYEMKSIEDVEAGEVLKNQGGLLSFLVTFKKSKLDGDTVKSEEQKFKLEISTLVHSETIHAVVTEPTLNY